MKTTKQWKQCTAWKASI